MDQQKIKVRKLRLNYEDWFYHTWHLNEHGGDSVIKDCKVCCWSKEFKPEFIEKTLKQNNGKTFKETVKNVGQETINRFRIFRNTNNAIYRNN